MAFTVEFITELDDTIFNRLFDDSIDDMNNGTYPWSDTPVASGDNEAKRTYIKTQLQTFLDMEDGVIIQVSQNDYPVMYIVGTLNSRDFIGCMALMGRNEANSKSWLYDHDYHTAYHLFQDAEFDTLEYQTLGSGTALHDHIVNEYHATVNNQPDWYQSTGAVPGGGVIGGDVAEGDANTDIYPAHSVRTDTLGNYRLKMTTIGNLTDDTGAADENEPEDDPERLQWLAGTHPDQQPTANT